MCRSTGVMELMYILFVHWIHSFISSSSSTSSSVFRSSSSLLPPISTWCQESERFYQKINKNLSILPWALCCVHIHVYMYLYNMFKWKGQNMQWHIMRSQLHIGSKNGCKRAISIVTSESGGRKSLSLCLCVGVFHSLSTSVPLYIHAHNFLLFTSLHFQLFSF